MKLVRLIFPFLFCIFLMRSFRDVDCASTGRSAFGLRVPSIPAFIGLPLAQIKERLAFIGLKIASGVMIILILAKLYSRGKVKRVDEPEEELPDYGSVWGAYAGLTNGMYYPPPAVVGHHKQIDYYKPAPHIKPEPVPMELPPPPKPRRVPKYEPEPGPFKYQPESHIYYLEQAPEPPRQPNPKRQPPKRRPPVYPEPPRKYQPRRPTSFRPKPIRPVVSFVKANSREPKAHRQPPHTKHSPPNQFSQHDNQLELGQRPPKPTQDRPQRKPRYGPHQSYSQPRPRAPHPRQTQRPAEQPRPQSQYSSPPLNRKRQPRPIPAYEEEELPRQQYPMMRPDNPSRRPPVRNLESTRSRERYPTREQSSDYEAPARPRLRRPASNQYYEERPPRPVNEEPTRSIAFPQEMRPSRPSLYPAESLPQQLYPANRPVLPLREQPYSLPIERQRPSRTLQNPIEPSLPRVTQSFQSIRNQQSSRPAQPYLEDLPPNESTRERPTDIQLPSLPQLRPAPTVPRLPVFSQIPPLPPTQEYVLEDGSRPDEPRNLTVPEEPSYLETTPVEPPHMTDHEFQDPPHMRHQEPPHMTDLEFQQPQLPPLEPEQVQYQSEPDLVPEDTNDQFQEQSNHNQDEPAHPIPPSSDDVQERLYPDHIDEGYEEGEHDSQQDTVAEADYADLPVEVPDDRYYSLGYEDFEAAQDDGNSPRVYNSFDEFVDTHDYDLHPLPEPRRPQPREDERQENNPWYYDFDGPIGDYLGAQTDEPVYQSRRWRRSNDTRAHNSSTYLGREDMMAMGLDSGDLSRNEKEKTKVRTKRSPGHFFRFIDHLDNDNCSRRLLCEIGADVSGFGAVGSFFSNLFR